MADLLSADPSLAVTWFDGNDPRLVGADDPDGYAGDLPSPGGALLLQVASLREGVVVRCYSAARFEPADARGVPYGLAWAQAGAGTVFAGDAMRAYPADDAQASTRSSLGGDGTPTWVWAANGDTCTVECLSGASWQQCAAASNGDPQATSATAGAGSSSAPSPLSLSALVAMAQRAEAGRLPLNVSAAACGLGGGSHIAPYGPPAWMCDADGRWKPALPVPVPWPAANGTVLAAADGAVTGDAARTLQLLTMQAPLPGAVNCTLGTGLQVQGQNCGGVKLAALWDAAIGNGTLTPAWQPQAALGAGAAAFALNTSLLVDIGVEPLLSDYVSVLPSVAALVTSTAAAAEAAAPGLIAPAPARFAAAGLTAAFRVPAYTLELMLAGPSGISTIIIPGLPPSDPTASDLGPLTAVTRVSLNVTTAVVWRWAAWAIDCSADAVTLPAGAVTGPFGALPEALTDLTWRGPGSTAAPAAAGAAYLPFHCFDTRPLQPFIADDMTYCDRSADTTTLLAGDSGGSTDASSGGAAGGGTAAVTDPDAVSLTARWVPSRSQRWVAAAEAAGGLSATSFPPWSQGTPLAWAQAERLLQAAAFPAGHYHWHSIVGVSVAAAPGNGSVGCPAGIAVCVGANVNLTAPPPAQQLQVASWAALRASVAELADGLASAAAMIDVNAAAGSSPDSALALLVGSSEPISPAAAPAQLLACWNVSAAVGVAAFSAPAAAGGVPVCFLPLFAFPALLQEEETAAHRAASPASPMETRLQLDALTRQMQPVLLTTQVLLAARQARAAGGRAVLAHSSLFLGVLPHGYAAAQSSSDAVADPVAVQVWSGAGCGNASAANGSDACVGGVAVFASASAAAGAGASLGGGSQLWLPADTLVSLPGAGTAMPGPAPIIRIAQALPQMAILPSNLGSVSFADGGGPGASDDPEAVAASPETFGLTVFSVHDMVHPLARLSDALARCATLTSRIVPPFGTSAASAWRGVTASTSLEASATLVVADVGPAAPGLVDFCLTGAPAAAETVALACSLTELGASMGGSAATIPVRGSLVQVAGTPAVTLDVAQSLGSIGASNGALLAATTRSIWRNTQDCLQLRVTVNSLPVGELPPSMRVLKGSLVCNVTSYLDSLPCGTSLPCVYPAPRTFTVPLTVLRTSYPWFKDAVIESRIGTLRSAWSSTSSDIPAPWSNMTASGGSSGSDSATQGSTDAGSTVQRTDVTYRTLTDLPAAQMLEVLATVGQSPAAATGSAPVFMLPLVGSTNVTLVAEDAAVLAPAAAPAVGVVSRESVPARFLPGTAVAVAGIACNVSFVSPDGRYLRFSTPSLAQVTDALAAAAAGAGSGAATGLGGEQFAALVVKPPSLNLTQLAALAAGRRESLALEEAVRSAAAGIAVPLACPPACPGAAGSTVFRISKGSTSASSRATAAVGSAPADSLDGNGSWAASNASRVLAAGLRTLPSSGSLTRHSPARDTLVQLLWPAHTQQTGGFHGTDEFSRGTSGGSSGSGDISAWSNSRRRLAVSKPPQSSTGLSAAPTVLPGLPPPSTSAASGFMYVQSCALGDSATFTDPSTGACLNVTDPRFSRCPWVDGSDGNNCKLCPPGAICSGRKAWPLRGFWASSDASGAVYACAAPAAERCL